MPRGVSYSHHQSVPNRQSMRVSAQNVKAKNRREKRKRLSSDMPHQSSHQICRGHCYSRQANEPGENTWQMMKCQAEEETRLRIQGIREPMWSIRCNDRFQTVKARGLPRPCVPARVQRSGAVASGELRRSTSGSWPCPGGSRRDQGTHSYSRSEMTETECVKGTAIPRWSCAGSHQRWPDQADAGRG